MHSSVEVRYPFLDEGVFDFCAGLNPTWKLHGFRDKHLLRLLAHGLRLLDHARRLVDNLLHIFHLLEESHCVCLLSSWRERRPPPSGDPNTV